MSSKLLTLFGGQGHFWNKLHSGFVRAGGISPDDWVNTNGLNSINGRRTFINASGVHAIRQTGTITRAHIGITTNASIVSLRIQVWRPISSGVWRLIAESDDVPNASLATGANVIPVSLACRVGDVLGVSVLGTATSGSQRSTGAAGDTGIRYKDGDVSGDVGSWGVIGSYTMHHYAECDPPAMCVVGDSLSVGGYLWATHLNTGGFDPITYSYLNDQGYQIASRLGSAGVTHQNHGRGGREIATVLSTDVPPALEVKPRVLWLHVGVNDSRGSTTLENFLASLDGIKALVDAASDQCTLVVAEILPWTDGTDEENVEIRQWNTAIRAWAAAAGVLTVLGHDQLGQVRISTGEIDDIVTAYNGDNIHLNAAGIAAYGSVVATRLRSIP